jgi:3-methylcrotonyl-CoA carboxylase alpha subunit
MIAKLIAHGADRDAARKTLAAACGDVQVWPVKTNAGFLKRVLDAPDFAADKIDTGFIEGHLAALVPVGGPPADALQAAARRRLVDDRPSIDPWSRLAGFRLGAPSAIKVALQMNGQLNRVTVNDELLPTQAIKIGETFVVFDQGEVYEFTEPRHAGGLAATAAGGTVVSPMPGRVAAVLVAKGDEVKTGQSLAVVEAMKMEYALTAPVDGVVAEIKVAVDSRVVEGQAVIRLEEA